MNNRKLLEPLPGDQPCGPDPFEDAALYAKLESLDRLRQGVPADELFESVVKDGRKETVVKTIPAKPPKWPEFLKECEAFLKKSRHLRALVLYGVGTLRLKGFPALPQTLQLVREALDLYWDSIHPRLAGDDASERLREINELSTPDGDDPPDAQPPDPNLKDGAFLSHLRELPLFSLPDGKEITFRLWQAAVDPILYPDVVAPALKSILAVLGNVPQDKRDETLRSLEDTLAELDKLEQILLRHKAPGNLLRLRRTLESMRSWMAGEMPGESAESGTGTPPKPVSTDGQEGKPPAVVRNREEVRQTIQVLCQYFEAQEPSSPVLLLLQLADKLVGRTFLEILNRKMPEKQDELNVLLMEGIRERLKSSSESGGS